MTIPVALFLFLTAVAILFQLALALGAPWGKYTLGGKYPFSRVAIWFVTSFFVLGSIAKPTTPRSGEGLVWGR